MQTAPILDDRIQCLPGVFTAGECADLLRVAEAIGFKAAPITTGAGFVMAPDIRNNTRVMVDDVRLAASLFERLSPSLAPRLGRYQLVGLNERFRFYRYGPGEFFAWHRDGAFYRDDREQSLVTLMIYLNDGFEGGSTDFDLPEGPVSIVPERGMVLLFHHPLRHQGAPVRRGEKLVLRTDVMYRRDPA